MATEHGARTTAFGTEIGRLDPGRKMDAVVIDYHKATYPFQDEDIPPLDALIHRAKTKDVKEVFIDGKLDRVEKDQEARKFVNELTHSYCMADEEHKKIVSEEQVGLDNISIDLREKLKSARKIMDQWQKVQEVSRIKKLIRERQDFFESESKKLGYKSKVFEMGDDIVIKIEDTGRKKIKIIEEEDREDSRLEGRN